VLTATAALVGQEYPAREWLRYTQPIHRNPLLMCPRKSQVPLWPHHYLRCAHSAWHIEAMLDIPRPHPMSDQVLQRQLAGLQEVQRGLEPDLLTSSAGGSASTGNPCGRCDGQNREDQRRGRRGAHMPIRPASRDISRLLPGRSRRLSWGLACVPLQP